MAKEEKKEVGFEDEGHGEVNKDFVPAVGFSTTRHVRPMRFHKTGVPSCVQTGDGWSGVWFERESAGPGNSYVSAGRGERGLSC